MHFLRQIVQHKRYHIKAGLQTQTHYTKKNKHFDERCQNQTECITK